jgi:SAM-dependent methyltransferase
MTQPQRIEPPHNQTTEPSDHLIIRSSDHHSDVTRAMNNMYRYTRHVYDASRKFYLLGRDRLIRELNAQAGEVVIEVGCGTARNLIKMARLYPEVRFYGLDASEEMLKTACENVARAGLADRIQLAHGFAQNFDPQAMFNLAPGSIDKIVFSYALSMIPPWQESVDHALGLLEAGSSGLTRGSIEGQSHAFPVNYATPTHVGVQAGATSWTPASAGDADSLASNGLHLHQTSRHSSSTDRDPRVKPEGPSVQPQKSIHIVDFGSQEGLPRWFRAFLFWWLDLFGVHFRPELPVYIAGLAGQHFRPQITQGLKGYYWMGRVEVR